MSTAITKKKSTALQPTKGLKSMLAVDARRMLTTSRFWICLGIALLMPILILTMTSMMSGSEIANAQTGEAATVEAFSSAWQIMNLWKKLRLLLRSFFSWLLIAIQNLLKEAVMVPA